MDLVVLPLIGDGRTPDTGFRPDVPAGIRWAQASSVYAAERKSLIYLPGATTEELERVLAVPGAVLVHQASAGERADSAALAAAVYGRPVPARGRSAALDEFVAAYREKALPIEAAAKDAIEAQRRRDLGLQVLWFLVQFGVAAAASRFGPESVALALTLLHFDDFNRSDRSLDGDTASDGLTVWSTVLGSFEILSNAAKGSDGGWVYDTVAAPVDRQRASVAARNAAGNFQFSYVAARCQAGAASGYIAGNADLRLWRVVSGAYALLTSTGSVVNDGALVACDCDGDQIRGLINGALDVGPATDTQWATGVGGMRGGGTQAFYDWQYEVGDGTEAYTPPAADAIATAPTARQALVAATPSALASAAAPVLAVAGFAATGSATAGTVGQAVLAAVATAAAATGPSLLAIIVVGADAVASAAAARLALVAAPGAVAGSCTHAQGVTVGLAAAALSATDAARLAIVAGPAATVGTGTFGALSLVPAPAPATFTAGFFTVAAIGPFRLHELARASVREEHRIWLREEER